MIEVFISNYLLYIEQPQIINTASITRTEYWVPLHLPNISKKKAIKAASDAAGKALVLEWLHFLHIY